MTKEAAFAALYETHYRQVRALCRQLLGSAERAEPFGPWIMKIARNHSLDLLRRRHFEPTAFGTEAEEAAAAEADDTDGLGELLTAERARSVQAAVSALPERYRVPLALAYFADAT